MEPPLLEPLVPPGERIHIRYEGTYYITYLFDNFVRHHSWLNRTLWDHFDESMTDYLESYNKYSAAHKLLEHFVQAVFLEDHCRASGLSYAQREHVPDSSVHERAHLLLADIASAHFPDDSAICEISKNLNSWLVVDPSSKVAARTTKIDLDEITHPLTESEKYGQLIFELAEEVFHVIFANRDLMHRLNIRLAEAMRLTVSQDWFLDRQEGERRLRRGRDQPTLLRTRIPIWARRAVFFRDRGICARCGRDLGNSTSPINREQFDHMVPLALGGLNDVTNLQLLCRDCNNRKSSQSVAASQIYERWYVT